MNLLKLQYRPLMGAVGIVPSTARRWATVGFFAEGQGQRWLVTAQHALQPYNPSSTITIHQGPWAETGHDIAVVTGSEILADAALDIAAIPVLSSLHLRPHIVGLGAWSAPVDVSVGDEVAKVGVGSGFVRGRVVSSQGHEFRIARPAGYPVDYSIAEPADSGAAWLALPSLELVGIHIGRAANGEAVASKPAAFFARFGLSPLAGQ